MTWLWFKVDVNYTEHPKIVQAGPAAAMVDVAGMGYCARYLTDGLIPQAQAHRIVPAGRRLVRRLIEVRRWHGPGHDCPRCPPCPDDSYVIHDYLPAQTSREQVEQKRAAARDRMARNRAKEPPPTGDVRANNTRTDSATTHERASNEQRTGDTRSQTPDGYSRSQPDASPLDAGPGVVERLLRPAARLVAEAELTRRLAHGDPIANPAGYVAARVPKLLADHEGYWRSLVETDADLTAEQLAADVVEPPAPADPPPPERPRLPDITDQRAPAVGPADPAVVAAEIAAARSAVAHPLRAVQ